MNKVFKKEIRDMLEVYMDDMIVKSVEESKQRHHLEEVFAHARQYNMHLNPEKCTFGVKEGKILGFYLTERGIEANPDKCRAVLEMEPPSSKERIMKLNGMLTALSSFISISAQHALPFFRLLRKEMNIEWTQECGEAFDKLKTILSQLPVLSKTMVGDIMYLYFEISAEAVSAVLVREVGTN